MGNKGCFTCRTRKMRCDSNRPVCGNCTKSQRVCEGYGVQLSWPREGDNRRALVSYDSVSVDYAAAKTPRKWGTQFLNTFHSDVSLSNALLEKGNLAHHLHTSRVPHLPYMPASRFEGHNIDLIDFFNQSTSEILTPVIDVPLAQFILKVALSETTSTNLVFEGVQMIASLHLQGPTKSRLHYARLVSKLRENIMLSDKANVLRNLIATMLLYQYEVCTTTSPQKIWSFYLCGAKKIIAASNVTADLYEDESAAILDWIFYHEVISEFSLRYWAEATAIDSFCKGPLAVRPEITATVRSSKSSMNSCPMEALNLIQIICKRPSTSSIPDTRYDETDMNQILGLKQRLQVAVGEYGTFHDMLGSNLTRQQMLAVLYRCATLIYLNRVVFGVGTTSFQHKRLVREGIIILQNLGFCESAWPVFILACEAVEDEQRLAIIETLSKTREQPLHRSQHVPLIQTLSERMWSQIDLHDDRDNIDFDYSLALHAVISTAPFLPLFA